MFTANTPSTFRKTRFDSVNHHSTAALLTTAYLFTSFVHGSRYSLSSEQEESIRLVGLNGLRRDSMKINLVLKLRSRKGFPRLVFPIGPYNAEFGPARWISRYKRVVHDYVVPLHLEHSIPKTVVNVKIR
ncbi:hypothetical protein AVEN_135006-1 [Araneus ventricosus]|uniref:Uncharacterized protein n=1 Tax=Araneus ventricosus TaxID=182803 RepID=A0A4Y2G7N3_ARAVE|nr:hypothetical protein AVEN_135006-1 [Araneus ventricosus]